jgi:hypothetical protein
MGFIFLWALNIPAGGTILLCRTKEDLASGGDICNPEKPRSLPLDSSRRLGRDIIGNAVNARNFIYDARSRLAQELM